MAGRIFYGWWIVVATSLIHFWGAGAFFYSFTAFFNPIVDEFGWSYTATSFAASIRSIEGGIASPLVGWAADRYGARMLLLSGSIVTGLGFILFSRIDSLWSFYLIYIFLSVGSSLLFPVPGWTVVTHWFSRYHGTAIGILSGSIGIGGALIYLVNVLIGCYGWRETLVIIGVVMWIVGIPSALAIRNRPEPYGLLPDGEVPADLQPRETGTRAVPVFGADFGLAEAMKTRAFWILALIVTLSSTIVHALMVHIMPHLISIGFGRDAAGISASLLVLASTAGRFGFGWLGSRSEKRYLLAACLLLQAAGLLILTGADSFSAILLFTLTFGPGYGGVITLRLTIQSEFFGKKAFGAIQGAVMALVVIGTMSGPLLTGIVFDLAGSYRSVWLAMGGAVFAIIPLTLILRSPQRAPKADTE